MRRFRAYTSLVSTRLAPRFNAAWHWAKLEVPRSSGELKAVRARLAARFPLKQVRAKERGTQARCRAG